MSQDYDEQARKKWTLTQWKLASSTMGVAAVADALSYLGPHGWGPTGLLVGGIASVLVADQGEKLAHNVKNRLPEFLIDAIQGVYERKWGKQEEQGTGETDEQGEQEVGEETRARRREKKQLLPAPEVELLVSTASTCELDWEPDFEASLLSPSSRRTTFRFSELLASGFVPTKDKIFVGRTMEGKDIFVAARDLCHVALAGKTGGGKGSLMRLLMVQLCYIGASVMLFNPHYMRYVLADSGRDFDEDWTPFEGINPRTGKPYLIVPPVESAEMLSIEELLTKAIEQVLAQRRRDGRLGGVRFKPYFLVFDEWPAIAAKIREAPAQLSELLREGRKYGVYVIVASQDFQVKTIGMDGGSVRKCLLTAYYTGGDPTSVKELLNEPGKSINEQEVGKGIAALRCVGTANKPVLVQVPFVDNKAVYRLLGPSTYRGPKKVEDDIEQMIATLPDVDPDDCRYAGELQPTRMLPETKRHRSHSSLDDRKAQRLARLRGAESVMLQAKPPSARLPVLSPELQMVWNAFEDGMSDHQLAKAIDVTHPTAGKYVLQLVSLGWIIVERDELGRVKSRRKVVNQ